MLEIAKRARPLLIGIMFTESAYRASAAGSLAWYLSGAAIGIAIMSSLVTDKLEELADEC